MGARTAEAIGLMAVAMSLPMTTAITPGRSTAALTSMVRIRACACGERSMAAWRMPATGSRSSMNRALPVRSAASSLRGSARPIHLVAVAIRRRTSVLVAGSEQGGVLEEALQLRVQQPCLRGVLDLALLVERIGRAAQAEMVGIHHAAEPF